MTNGAATPTANNSIFDEIADTTARQQNTASARASRCEGSSKKGYGHTTLDIGSEVE